MQCPQCGNESPDGAKFCPCCGARLDSKKKKPKINGAVIAILVLSILFGGTTAINDIGISATDLETCELDAGIYVMNANLNMVAYEYEDCANWDCIFVYSDGWKLLDTIWNYDIKEKETDSFLYNTNIEGVDE